MIVPTGVKVSGAGLADQGTNDFQGSSYQVYSGGPLKAGSALALNLSGSPQTPAAGSAGSGTVPVLQIVLGSLGLLLVLAGVIFFLLDRRKRTAMEMQTEMATGQAETIGLETMDDETARLADAILALDDRFAAGKIDPETYAQQRAELKKELKGLL